MNKSNIIIFRGCRSDWGLSDPIIKRLKDSDWCQLKVVDLIPQEYVPSYQIAEYCCKAENHIGNSQRKKPHLVIIVGDRVEQAAAAQAAFLNNIKICHIYAGATSNVATYDDILRHQITLVSDIQFVESYNASWVVWDLKKAANLPTNIHEVGITSLDDLEIDESKCHVFPYTLILYNNPTITDHDIQELFACSYLYNDYTILIEGNPDGKTNTQLLELVDEWHPNLPRSQFLGLLKNCQRFITNSSAAYYEAPYFLKPEQIIMVGERNRNRSTVIAKPGGSDKVINVLKEYLTCH